MKHAGEDADLVDFLDFVGNLCSAFSNYQGYEKPRRVFTRRFVAFCVFVAVCELAADLAPTRTLLEIPS
jgi:hypothetical protein